MNRNALIASVATLAVALTPAASMALPTTTASPANTPKVKVAPKTQRLVVGPGSMNQGGCDAMHNAWNKLVDKAADQIMNNDNAGADKTLASAQNILNAMEANCTVSVS